jgi:hypothetical protein
MKINVNFEANYFKTVERTYNRRDGQGQGTIREIIIEFPEGVETLSCTEECYTNANLLPRLSACVFTAEYNKEYNSFRIVNLISKDKPFADADLKDANDTAAPKKGKN